LLSSHRGTPEKLRAAVAQSNHADLAFAAHSLASAVGAMQAHDLRAFAKRVEELARQGRLDAFGLALELATKTESFLAAVQRELPPDPSVPSR
jgi:HPt (histidine-containing phosphotransfer) domain-containing protein